MKAKRHLIIRDSKDINNNIELLTDEEVAEQFQECYKLCKDCLSPVDKTGDPAIEYCTVRLGDLIDYTIALADAAEKRGKVLHKSRGLTNLKNIKKRVNDDQSKIAPFFTDKYIDWDELKKLQ